MIGLTGSGSVASVRRSTIGRQGRATGRSGKEVMRQTISGSVAGILVAAFRSRATTNRTYRTVAIIDAEPLAIAGILNRTLAAGVTAQAPRVQVVIHASAGTVTGILGTAFRPRSATGRARWQKLHRTTPRPITTAGVGAFVRRGPTAHLGSKMIRLTDTATITGILTAALRPRQPTMSTGIYEATIGAGTIPVAEVGILASTRQVTTAGTVRQVVWLTMPSTITSVLLAALGIRTATGISAGGKTVVLAATSTITGVLRLTGRARGTAGRAKRSVVVTTGPRSVTRVRGAACRIRIITAGGTARSRRSLTGTRSIAGVDGAGITIAALSLRIVPSDDGLALTIGDARMGLQT